jgi:hypothetical protein
MSHELASVPTHGQGHFDPRSISVSRGKRRFTLESARAQINPADARRLRTTAGAMDAAYRRAIKWWQYRPQAHYRDDDDAA